MRNKFLLLFALLVSANCAFAGGKEAIGYKIMQDPSILTEPSFWIVVIIGLVLVGIYFVVKDKDE